MNQPQQPMQQPLRRDFEKYNAHGPSRQKGANTLYLPQGQRTTIVLLDDIPVRVCRHKLFIKGDKTATKMRQTCAGMDPAQFPEPVPRMCLVCNASIRDRRIGRDDFANLTCIDERQYTYEGKNFVDMRLLIELDDARRSVIEEFRKQYGSLVGMRFGIYRSDSPTSSRIGDSWTPMGRVGAQPATPNQADLVRHFWKSPAVGFILESMQKRGVQNATYQAAVAQLVTPIDYQKEMGTYNPAEAEQFVAYVSGAPASGGGGGRGGFEVPPVPGGEPNQYAMPSHQVPQTQMQQPPYQPQAQPAAQPFPQGPPMGMAQGQPPQGMQGGYGPPPQPQGYPAPPPPSMPDPMGSTPPPLMPQGMWPQPPQQPVQPPPFQAPPMPMGMGAFPAPVPQPQPGYAPQPSQGFLPPQGMQPPPPMQGAQGWSQQAPGFPSQPQGYPAPQPPPPSGPPPQGAFGKPNDPPF